MGSKIMIAVIFGMLAMLLLISSEVAARDLREGEFLGASKTVGLGGNFGFGTYGGYGPYYGGGGIGGYGPYYGGGGIGGYIPPRGRRPFLYPGRGFGFNGPDFNPYFGFGGGLNPRGGVFPGSGLGPGDVIPGRG